MYIYSLEKKTFEKKTGTEEVALWVRSFQGKREDLDEDPQQLC